MSKGTGWSCNANRLYESIVAYKEVDQRFVKEHSECREQLRSFFPGMTGE